MLEETNSESSKWKLFSILKEKIKSYRKEKAPFQQYWPSATHVALQPVGNYMAVYQS